ncbi:MAG TPA: hypothetical protein VIJ40_00480 [Acidimicrobiales bacterium]
MTLTLIREPNSQTLPDAGELLIKEARVKMRRRRLRYTVASLIVLVAGIVVWQGSGGTTHPTSPPRVKTSSPKNGSSTGPTNLAAITVLGGQSIDQVVPFGPRILWVWTTNEVKLSGGGQDIELTANAGKTWTNVTPPNLRVDGGSHWINGFFALSATRAWLIEGGAGKGPQTLETTSDAGLHWLRVGVLPPSGCSLEFVTAQDGTCSQLWGAGGSMPIGIYRTTDGGASWHKIFQSGASSASTSPGSIPFACDKSIYFENAAKGFVFFLCNGGTGAIIYETSNGGVTWAPQKVEEPSPVPLGGGGFTGLPVFNGLRGAVTYGGGSYSAIYVTSDGGRSFHPVYPPGKRLPWAIDLVTATQWRLTYQKEILETNNGGASWFDLTSDTVLMNPSYVKGAPPGGLVVFDNTNDGWLIENQYSSNSSLLRTTDEGRQWHKVRVPGTQKL